MRKSFLIAMIAVFSFIACNNKQESHNHNSDGSHQTTAGMHEHEDGSVHTDHPNDVKQESFTVDQDSTAVETKKKTEHDHSDPNHSH